MGMISLSVNCDDGQKFRKEDIRSMYRHLVSKHAGCT